MTTGPVGEPKLDICCTAAHNQPEYINLRLLARKQRIHKDSDSPHRPTVIPSLSLEPRGSRDAARFGPAHLTVSTRHAMSHPNAIPPASPAYSRVPTSPALAWGIHRRFVNGRVEYFAVGWTGIELPFLGVPVGDETETDVIGRLWDCLCLASPRPLSEGWRAWPPRAARPALQLVRG